MFATMEFVELLEKSEQLGVMIRDSEVMAAYSSAQSALYQNSDTKAKIDAFTAIKEQYEEVQRFGRYHPDYSFIMKEIRSKKREMDMDANVAAFKIAERNLQKLLDDISAKLASTVSENVKAPRSGAALKDSGCGCGSGGACGCAS
ncbi:YlbF family regulator [Terribacillus saccharophilus]|uniref:Regulator n=1 Tax=Terribacillus saccharophilus TaxID=361277 RepID=A0A268AA80_9BACI|nr:YlbF family regulator [Terribacillus saccharophilus]PAD20979.1 regulator [Terribacillus saccharophilus]PAF16742.1 regulator [Terribacillus saccharophilus]PAF22039.1 regulator [Terribacillus saccharophilus]PAF38259.1 regulator [Terribacillus saccharophilus]PAF39456.1 regulator [Terribacillus saccharophilus]